jgi:hypothetical protein
LVDDDILTPGNLVRHDLDVGSLGAHKAVALAARLKATTAGVTVTARQAALGGQEASGSTASVLNELATCDLLIDATADPQAFNFVASVATNRLRPMVWAEVYAGGVGGFVARLRPGLEPPPHSARRQYFAWCRAQGVPWHGLDQDYAAQGIAAETLIADDSDVAVIAAHATRMAVDVLVHPDNTAFPHPAYAIGLAKQWIFSEPFDTRPIDLAPDGEWTPQISPERFRRFNYLGEWHSHPSFSVRPSAQDVSTMTDIVEDQNSLISFAVILIVRLRLRLWIEHSVTIFARDRTPQSRRISRRVAWTRTGTHRLNRSSACDTDAPHDHPVVDQSPDR